MKTKKDETALTNVESPIYVNIDEDMQETSNEVQETEGQETVKENLTRSDILNEMKSKIGYRARVVPFNSIQWVEGVVTGVLDDVRAKNPLWTVKDLKTGKVIRKAFGSDLIEILDEKVEDFSLKQRSISPKTEKDVEDLLKTAWSYVGHFCEISDNRFLIKSVVLDKRTNTVLLKLVDEKTNRQFYKTVGNIGTILDETDLETLERAEKRLSELLENDDPVKKREKLVKKMDELNAKIVELRNEVAKIRQELSEMDETLETVNETSEVTNDLE